MSELSPLLSYTGSNFIILNWRWNSHTKDIGSGLKSGPIAIFDEDGGTVVISPFSKFMAASSRFAADDSIGWGIMGGVKEVPAGYQFETIVYHAKGINKV